VGLQTASDTSRMVSSILAILAPSHGIFYCYDIPRYIMTLAILVSSRTYRRYVSRYRGYRATLPVAILLNLLF